MKKVIVLPLLLVLCVTFAIGQKKNKKGEAQPAKVEETTPVPAKKDSVPPTPQQPQMSPLAEHFAKKYSIATRWGDYDLVKDALYDLIIEYPNSDSLIYVLAYTYYENQKYASCVLIAQDLVARNSKNDQALQLLGAGYESLNIFDRALQAYESHYLLTENSVTLYRMAFLQHQSKRYPEALTNVDILLAKPEVETIKMDFTDPKGLPKQYSLKVLVLNLKGEVYREQGDKVNARKFFTESLKLAPDFAVAKKNLEVLK